MIIPSKPFVVGVVGPCAAGKSTLVAALSQAGVVARHIAQEHSYVPDMWRRITNPDLLVFLDVSYPMTIQRCHLDWTEADYAEQQRRLQHARENAGLYIDTDHSTPLEIRQYVLDYLKTQL